MYISWLPPPILLKNIQKSFGLLKLNYNICRAYSEINKSMESISNDIYILGKNKFIKRMS